MYAGDTDGDNDDDGYDSMVMVMLMMLMMLMILMILMILMRKVVIVAVIATHRSGSMPAPAGGIRKEKPHTYLATGDDHHCRRAAINSS